VRKNDEKSYRNRKWEREKFRWEMERINTEGKVVVERTKKEIYSKIKRIK
jgi:hypothetical protein